MSKSNKVRVSNHTGRRGSAKHNGRGFDTEKAPHIDTGKTRSNAVWGPVVESDGAVRIKRLTAAEAKGLEARERELYRQKFSAAIEAQNDKYRKKGQYGYCRTVDQVYEGKQTQPVEMILQVGNKDQAIPAGTFAKAEIEWLNWLMGWNKQHGGHLQVMSNAIHVDETSPHAHFRYAWVASTPDGLALKQDKAMEQAGIELPKPGEKRTKYNNRAQTFSRMCRDKWIEICQGYGIEVELEPIKGRKHKSKEDYIQDQESQRVKDLEAREEAVFRDREANEAARADLEAHREALAEAEGKYRAECEKALEGLQKAVDAQREVVQKVTAWAKQHGYGKSAEQIEAHSERAAKSAAKAQAKAQAQAQRRGTDDLDSVIASLDSSGQSGLELY